METTNSSTRSIPILITWDMDPDQWMPFDRRQRALYTTLDLCQRHHIPATFYVTAQYADAYAADFNAMQIQGHEIGCHGLTHGDEEDYNRMPKATQREYISQAFQRMQIMLGAPVRTFRSPRVKTSAQTLKLLAEFGFWSDSSVCSQRMDLVSSNLINFGWLFAPRRPYHPNLSSAFRRGDISILEIPVSALFLPFISSSLAVIGLPLMKIFFRLLHTEARYTGKPIVYLAHPIEFAPRGKGKVLEPLRPKYFSFSYIRSDGFRFRRLFYRSDFKRLLEQTDALFAFMASFPDVSFMTVNSYINQHNKNSLIDK